MKSLIQIVGLLVCSLSFAQGGFGSGKIPTGTGATSFLRDGTMTLVSEDTGTPANSRPLPVSFSGALLGSVNQGTPNTSANAWPIKITDGTDDALVSAAGRLTVDGSGVTQPVSGTFWQATQPVSGTFWQATQPVSAASLPLPSGAATEAKQDTQITSLSSIDTSADKVADAATTDGAVQPPNLLVVGGSDGTNVYPLLVGTSGRMEVDVISSALPSGASTAAKQDTQITSLGSIDTKLPSGLTVSSTRLLVDPSGVTQPISAASLPLPALAATSTKQSDGTQKTQIVDGSGNVIASTANAMNVALAANQSVNVAQINGVTVLMGAGNTGTGSQRVTIATDQAAVQIKDGKNVTGSGTTGTVSTVITLTAPANAVGFILQNLDTSTANVRWALGRTATTTVGNQLQSGRDSGYVPFGGDVSLVAESGTQGYDITWISQ